MDTVTRYVLTYVNRDGVRTLTDPAQGRYTYETAEEAQRHLDAVLGAADGIARLAAIFGPQAVGTFAVRPVACYPGHFDPTTVWFD